MWNIDFSGTDGYSDTLSITGTISTEPGTSPYTIDEVDLTYTQIGIPGDPCPGPYCEDINDSSTTLQTSYFGADNVLCYPASTSCNSVPSSDPAYLDNEGLGFVLASSGGGDGSGNDVIFYSDEANAYCVPQDDEPWFCGTLTVTPATAPSATPEPGSLGLLGLGMFALPAAVFLRRKIGSMTA
jgi:hypothetical protein